LETSTITGMVNGTIETQAEQMPDENQIIFTKLEEAEREAAEPNTVWLSHDQVFGKLREKYGYEV